MKLQTHGRNSSFYFDIYNKYHAMFHTFVSPFLFAYFLQQYKGDCFTYMKREATYKRIYVHFIRVLFLSRLTI